MGIIIGAYAAIVIFVHMHAHDELAKYVLPHWSTPAQNVLLLQPSSAASERVFSLLNNCFSSRQECSLSD